MLSSRVTGDRHHRRANRLRQVASGALAVAAAARAGIARRSAASPDALWRPGEGARSALRVRCAICDAANCTAEEREEYEPHIAAGNVVFAGVDYADILHMAEAEAQLIVWDGGNNDFSVRRPDLQITVVDALRPRQVATHHPGEAVARMADVIVINKVDAAARRRCARRRRRGEGGQPDGHDHARCIPGPAGRRCRGARAARARRRGRADHHPWRHADGCRLSGRAGRGRARSSIRGCRRLPSCRTFIDPIRTSARCCRRWAMGPSNCGRSRPRSIAPMPTLSSQGRRSICKTLCRSKSRWCARATNSPRSGEPSLSSHCR